LQEILASIVPGAPADGAQVALGFNVTLFVQPGDGVAPLVKAISAAKSSVEIMIFRFDRREIELALVNAVSRGVTVHALIAYTNRGGEKHLRDLEMRLLAAGITVGRTADDLVRYHAKFMIIDRRDLYLLAFNFTYLDIDHSRSFGLLIRDGDLVQEAVKVFEADTKRKPYSPGLPEFVVSPANARKQLAAFIKGAKTQLLIYDPKITDRAMIRLLEERATSGVDVRIIGRLSRKTAGVEARKLMRMRLHTRTMIRDRAEVFMGSQSLRPAELDARREVGVIVRDSKLVSRLIKIFDEDWGQSSEANAQAAVDEVPAAKVAKKVAKAITKDLPPVAPMVEVMVREVAGRENGVNLNAEELEVAVKDAMKEAIKEVVRDAVQEVVEQET
jgi:cardiolipin synthase